MVQVLQRTNRRFTHINLAGCGAVVLVVAGWELLTSTGALTLDYVPAPSAVLDTLISTTLTGALLADTGHTLGVAFAAFGSALVVGGAPGTLLALQRTVWIWTMTSVGFLRSVPVIPVMPIFITLRLSRVERITKVLLPSLLPGVFAGTKVAVSTSPLVTLLVEILDYAAGLGRLVKRRQQYDSASVWGILVLIGTFGYVLNLMLRYVESRPLRNWGGAR